MVSEAELQKITRTPILKVVKSFIVKSSSQIGILVYVMLFQEAACFYPHNIWNLQSIHTNCLHADVCNGYGNHVVATHSL